MANVVTLEKPINDVSEDDVRAFSKTRNEPEWVLRLRLKALKYLKRGRSSPYIDPLMADVTFKMIIDSYEKPTLDSDEALKIAKSLGIPEEEIKLIASGFSVNVDNRLIKYYLDYLKAKGVIIAPMEKAIKKYGIIRNYLFKVMNLNANRRTAYHALLWSGGVFIYVPPNTKIAQPLYGLFLIGKEGLSQTEHTLIIVDENSSIYWIEGCTTPLPLTYAVHLGGLEALVKRSAELRVVSINNWLGDVHHRPVKKVKVYDEGFAELTSIAFRSKTSYTTPTIELEGNGAKGVIQSIGVYRDRQKVLTAPLIKLIGSETSGQILNRTVVMDEAFEIFKGTLRSEQSSRNSFGHMSCNTLVLSEKAISKAIPSLDVRSRFSELSHEASIGRVSYEKLYYLSLLGLSEEESTQLIVNGFLNPIVSKLPYDLQVEVKKIISLALKAH